MKILRSSLFRAVCSIVTGGLLTTYPSETATWIIIFIGVLFMVSGAISCVTYFMSRRSGSDVFVTDANGRRITPYRPSFPIVGAGSLILGLILAFMPETFRDFLSYILAFILILGTANQFAALVACRRMGMVEWGFWVFPSIIFVVGVVTLFRPEWVASFAVSVVGVTLMVYGAVEIANALKIHKMRKLFSAGNVAENKEQQG